MSQHDYSITQRHLRISVGLNALIFLVGLAANTFSTLLMRKDAVQDLNAKSAFLHLLSDAVESLGVILVGMLIYWRQWYVLDPIVSVAIGAFIIKSAWDILLETVNILTEGTPRGIDLNVVAATIRLLPDVEDVHHLHIWSLSSNFRALSAHIVVKDQMISEGSTITARLEQALEEEFSINHIRSWTRSASALEWVGRFSFCQFLYSLLLSYYSTLRRSPQISPGSVRCPTLLPGHWLHRHHSRHFRLMSHASAEAISLLALGLMV